MQNTNSINQEKLLNDILPLPADKVITDRFAESLEAGCSGNCNGTCSAIG